MPGLGGQAELRRERRARPRRHRGASRALLALSIGLPLATLPIVVCAQAVDLTGDHTVTLLGTGGEQVPIARVHLERTGTNAWRFSVRPIDGVFTERFLAMRPFRCLAGSREQLCHMPLRQ